MRSGPKSSRCLAHIALIVRDYDEAIAWFTEKLGFTLVPTNISPSRTSAGSSSLRPAPARAPPPSSSPAPRRRSRRPSFVFLFLMTDGQDRGYNAFRDFDVFCVGKLLGRRNQDAQPYS